MGRGDGCPSSALADRQPPGENAEKFPAGDERNMVNLNAVHVLDAGLNVVSARQYGDATSLTHESSA
jgi:hypothetical protein